MYVCGCIIEGERGGRVWGGGELLLLCLRYAQHFQRLCLQLCSFHTELMITLNTLLLAGTDTHTHTHVSMMAHTHTGLHRGDLSDADATAASLDCRNINIFCSLCAWTSVAGG